MPLPLWLLLGLVEYPCWGNKIHSRRRMKIQLNSLIAIKQCPYQKLSSLSSLLVAVWLCLHVLLTLGWTGRWLSVGYLMCRPSCFSRARPQLLEFGICQRGKNKQARFYSTVGKGKRRGRMKFPSLGGALWPGGVE